MPIRKQIQFQSYNNPSLISVNMQPNPSDGSITAKILQEEPGMSSNDSTIQEIDVLFACAFFCSRFFICLLWCRCHPLLKRCRAAAAAATSTPPLAPATTASSPASGAATTAPTDQQQQHSTENENGACRA